MAIVRDLKTGEFLEIPEKDAQKYVIPPDKVREKLAGLGGGPAGPTDAQQPGYGGGIPGTLVLNLNLADLLQGQGGAPGGFGAPPPGYGPPPGHAQIPVGAGAGPGPGQVNAQWWQWHPNYYHPYYHPYYGPGLYVRL